MHFQSTLRISDLKPDSILEKAIKGTNSSQENNQVQLMMLKPVSLLGQELGSKLVKKYLIKDFINEHYRFVFLETTCMPISYKYISHQIYIN